MVSVSATSNEPSIGVNTLPNSTKVLSLCGLILIGIGLYFIFVRPEFLPEDARSVGASLSQIQTTAPNIAQWLGRVFWVLGGYIIATGILTLYIAFTSFRNRRRGVLFVVVSAGIASVGLMATVNVLLNSDFKWPLIGLAGIWTLAIILYGWGK